MASVRLTGLAADRARILGIGLVVVGLGCLVVAFLRIGNAGLVVDQLAYLFTGAMGGLFLIVIGGALFVTSELRRRCQALDAAAQGIVPAGHPSAERNGSTNGTRAGRIPAVSRS